MSLIRLSVLKDKAYAPEAYGGIALHDYSRAQRRPLGLGGMETLTPPELAAPNSDFRHYIDRAVKQAIDVPDFRGPIVVMIHGFLFDPRTAVSEDPKDTDNPHGRVYHFTKKPEPQEQRHHTASWPLGLGFDTQLDGGRQGLAVAFGWQSQPGFASSLLDYSQNFYARAYDNAGRTAWVLVNLITALAESIPDRPIDLFCHSLGSRVVLRALALIAKHADEGGPGVILDTEVSKRLLQRVGRVIILGGAEYVVEAQLMCRRLSSRDLASMPHFYNIVSRENDVLDKLAENFGPRTFGNSQVIGHNGLNTEYKESYWIDLQIDSGALREWMRDPPRNIDISGDNPGNVWDHWYYYTYRGNMELYKNILRERDSWSIVNLRDAGVPDGVPLRWWRLGD